jgi:hypothetical protein
MRTFYRLILFIIYFGFLSHCNSPINKSENDGNTFPPFAKTTPQKFDKIIYGFSATKEGTNNVEIVLDFDKMYIKGTSLDGAYLRDSVALEAKNRDSFDFSSIDIAKFTNSTSFGKDGGWYNVRIIKKDSSIVESHTWCAEVLQEHKKLWLKLYHILEKKSANQKLKEKLRIFGNI